MSEQKCGKCQGPLDKKEPGIGLCTTCEKDFEEWEKGTKPRLSQPVLRRRRRDEHNGDAR